jgi:hypothetical protein
MTEHDYEKAMKLLQAVEVELREGDPEDAHCLLTEAMSLLNIEAGGKDYDYFEMDMAKVYPVCDRAKIFAGIAGTKTLLPPDIERIQLLGYKVAIKPRELSL